MDPHELDAALRSPATWSHLAPGIAGVEVIETHLSRLYFAGDFVFKVKKAVDLGFVDFTTLERRRQACEDEVRLNRRLAPDIYLGVASIARDASGRIRVGAPVASAAPGAPAPAGVAPIVEYAVQMKRLPAAHMLDARLARGEIDSERLERIVATLASFHEHARRGPDVDAFATPEAIAALVLGNLDESVAAAGRLDRACGSARSPSLPPAIAAALRGAFERFLAEERPRLEARARDGRICEGHGDLHAGNLCVLPGRPLAEEPAGRAERIVAFDCIEFSLPLRCLDVAADLAFLLMDLDRLGFPAFGRDLARRYAQRTGDPGLEALLGFYKAHLACVRGKVSALRGIGTADAGERARARAEARRFFALAVGYALPPFVIATCGLPGSGKSFVAGLVAGPLAALHVQSDVERKLLAGLVPGERTPPERETEVYSGRMTFRTYVRMEAIARREVRRGRRVLLDATYPAARLRERARALARSIGAAIVFLHCRVDDAEARRRLAAREGEAGQFSEADVAVYERAKRRFEPPDELEPAQRVDVGGEAVAEELVMAILERVIAQLEAAGRSPLRFATDASAGGPHAT